MSGSGGGIPVFKNPEVDCADISLTTSLSSPDPIIVAKIKVGDRLEILKIPPKAIGVYNLDGELAGALLTTLNAKLLECLEKGYEFEGTVVSKAGANCKILIRAK
jgi:hypothetical protein